jgi:CubicO group peptidase (beta-lactamase class C family)
MILMRKVLLVSLVVSTMLVSGAAAQVVLQRAPPGAVPMPSGAGQIIMRGPQLEPLPAAALAAAEQRAREVVALIDRGNRAEIQSYTATNWRRRQAPSAAAGGPPPVAFEDLLARFHFESGGATLESVKSNDAGTAVTALYRSKMTGLTKGFNLVVAPEAPHLITQLMPLRPQLTDVPSLSTDEERAAYIDAVASRMAAADFFSGVVIIARDDEPLLAKAYGFEDRDARRLNRLDSRFNIGSMNKLFTALAIMQLVERGKISLDDPIARFLPDYPGADRIQVKHLLSHTSGLGSYFGPAFFARPMTNYRGMASYLEAAGREPPAFEPGSRWLYSNTGMLLAGRIVEIASGKNYYDYVRENIYRPAGMTRTDSYEIDKLQDRAVHYDKDWTNGGRLTEVDSRTPVRGSPAGGGLATAPDLLSLSAALRTGKLANPQSLVELRMPRPELNSPRYGYGFDLGRFAEPHRRIAGHGGDAPGTCAEFGDILDTSSAYTVIVLGNGNAMGSCHPIAIQAYALFGPD